MRTLLEKHLDHLSVYVSSALLIPEWICQHLALGYKTGTFPPFAMSGSIGVAFTSLEVGFSGFKAA